MTEFNINGTFLIRTGTHQEWSAEGIEGKGALRILNRGEIGWIYQTSQFKIGDGITKFRDLPFISPDAPRSDYADRIGTKAGSFTYQDIYDAFESITSQLEENKQYVIKNETKYYQSFLNFPSVGIKGPLYVDCGTNDMYYWNDDNTHGDTVGYKKLTNSFDVIQCALE